MNYTKRHYIDVPYQRYRSIAAIATHAESQFLALYNLYTLAFDCLIAGVSLTL
jgi:hypothetical protein